MPDTVDTQLVTMISVMAGMLSIAMTGMLVVVRRMTTRPENDFKKFRASIVSGLGNDIVCTLQDVKNLMLGCLAPWQREALTDRLGDWLRRILVGITSEEPDIVGDVELHEIVKWAERLKSFIAELDEKNPYAGLPDAEKNLLNDIEHFVREQAAEKAQDRLVGLASLIQARTDDAGRLRLINRWTIPISIAGSLLTIAFGVLALVT